jgi:hypothetical protein
MIQGVLGSNTLSAGITWAQGGIPYAGAVQTIAQLAKSTDSCMLTNYGASNNPSWVKISNMTYTGTFSGIYIGVLGVWVDKVADYGVQQAPSDGWIRANAAINGSIAAYTDSANPPTTIRDYATSNTGAVSIGISTLVRKNDYWKLTIGGGAFNSVYWIPLGA